MSSKTRVAPNDLETLFADSEAMDFPPKSGTVSQRSIYQKKRFNLKEHKGHKNLSLHGAGRQPLDDSALKQQRENDEGERRNG